MSTEAWSAPTDALTTPDQIDLRAREELDRLPGERILRCWKTALGFLVMTNLRVVGLWHKPQLFAPGEWHAGPTFFYYNLGPIHVIAARFVELAEIYDEGAGSARFLVEDPGLVAREIEGARITGRAEWDARRRLAQEDLHRPHPLAPPPGTTVVVREIVKVRCAFCGNLIPASSSLCPSCGAPQR